MRVLFVAARELSYPRNEVLLRALRRFAEVDAIGPDAAPGSLLRASAQMTQRALGALRRGRYDLVLVGFYGYLIAQALSRITRTPLLFDAFVSNYDTLVADRGRFAPGSAGAQLARLLDSSTCARADQILLDTQAHAAYFVREIGVPAAKITVLPVGCSEERFVPLPQAPAAPGLPLRVLYYCSWLPLHGGSSVVEAAAQLADLPLEFRLVGDGPQRAGAEQIAARCGVQNVRFLPALPADAIAHELAQAHICLGGHFGRGDKAQRTIPGKLYQMLAAARPVIAGDSPANRELLRDGVSALMTPAADPAALAAALRRLAGDAALRATIAAGGRAAYEASASEAVITARLRAQVQAMVGKAGAQGTPGVS